MRRADLRRLRPRRLVGRDERRQGGGGEGRLLRAGVGALNHASEENSFKRPRPVIIREHGAFAGFVVEPARSRPVVVAFSRITSVEMPFAPRPRVEDAVLAASLSARFRTEAGEPRTLDLAFQSAAVAYMIADGLELARRQAARPPSPRASAGCWASCCSCRSAC